MIVTHPGAAAIAVLAPFLLASCATSSPCPGTAEHIVKECGCTPDIDLMVAQGNALGAIQKTEIQRCLSTAGAGDAFYDPNAQKGVDEKKTPDQQKNPSTPLTGDGIAIGSKMAVPKKVDAKVALTACISETSKLDIEARKALLEVVKAVPAAKVQHYEDWRACYRLQTKTQDMKKGEMPTKSTVVFEWQDQNPLGFDPWMAQIGFTCGCLNSVYVPDPSVPLPFLKGTVSLENRCRGDIVLWGKKESSLSESGSPHDGAPTMGRSFGMLHMPSGATAIAHIPDGTIGSSIGPIYCDDRAVPIDASLTPEQRQEKEWLRVVHAAALQSFWPKQAKPCQCVAVKSEPRSVTKGLRMSEKDHYLIENRCSTASLVWVYTLIQAWDESGKMLDEGSGAFYQRLLRSGESVSIYPGRSTEAGMYVPMCGNAKT